jgi:hypothetical protein
VSAFFLAIKPPGNDENSSLYHNTTPPDFPLPGKYQFFKQKGSGDDVSIAGIIRNIKQ